MRKAKSRANAEHSIARATRRKFLKSAGAGAGAALLSSTAAAPFIFVRNAVAADKELKIVLWSHFVPAYDKWYDQFVKDWGAKNGVDVRVRSEEHTSELQS